MIHLISNQIWIRRQAIDWANDDQFADAYICNQDYMLTNLDFTFNLRFRRVGHLWWYRLVNHFSDPQPQPQRQKGMYNLYNRQLCVYH